MYPLWTFSVLSNIQIIKHMYKLLLSHLKEIFQFFYCRLIFIPLILLKGNIYFNHILIFYLYELVFFSLFSPKLRHFNIKISNSANRSFSPQGSTPSPPQTFVITINLFILHLLAENIGPNQRKKKSRKYFAWKWNLFKKIFEVLLKWGEICGLCIFMKVTLI